jgi:hypothetical protein
MKHQADKHRAEREFAVGDNVYLKLQPYVQTSIARHPHQKLAFRYYGPYTVLQCIGSVAYKLNLPETSQIHPVVHVLLLKKAIGPTALVSAQLPPSISMLQAIHLPVNASRAPLQANLEASAHSLGGSADASRFLGGRA